MINVNNVTLRFGKRTLFENVNIKRSFSELSLCLNKFKIK